MKKRVMQEWTEDLTYMQQSVLIAAVRGPDGIRKDHPVKLLCRWLRRCFLVAAFEGVALNDPYEPGGGSFTGPARSILGDRLGSVYIGNLVDAQEMYFRSIDELPHHFQLHLMHAAEILGYKHPIPVTREWWRRFYLHIVNDAHLFPESEGMLDLRLGDSEEAWRAHEKFTAV